MTFDQFNTIYPQCVAMIRKQSDDEYFDALAYIELISGIDYDLLLRMSEKELHPYTKILLQFQAIYAGEFMPTPILTVNGKKYKVRETFNMAILKVGHLQYFKQVSTNIVRRHGLMLETFTDAEKQAYTGTVQSEYIKQCDYLAAIMLEPKAGGMGNVNESIENIRQQLANQPFYSVVSAGFFLLKRLIADWPMLASWLQVAALSTPYMLQESDWRNSIFTRK